MPVVTLLPVRQYVPATVAAEVTVETPAVFGSVSDGSDATYTQLEGEWDEANVRHSGVLSVDFGPVGFNPSALYMMVRARNTSPYDAGTVSLHTDYAKVDGGSYDTQSVTGLTGGSGFQLNDLAAGSQAATADLPFYLLSGFNVDTSDPTSSTWLQLGSDQFGAGYAAWEALRTTGIRFDIYVEALGLSPRRAYVDVFEVRMIVAYEEAAGLPWLRQALCRDDHRVWPSSSWQATNRRLGGYY